MAVASDKAEDVELQPLNQTAEDDQDDVTSPAPKKERKDDPTKSSDFKRMHSYPEDKRAVVKKPKQKAASHSHPELIRRMQSTPELQLKDHHVPYKLRKVWPELLKKFTNANNEAVEKDEPILCYKRNSFFPLAEEKKITDENMIRRLFEEAKFNVLTGRYPVDNERALKLGGIVALIEHGKFIEKDHHVGFFKCYKPDILGLRGKLGEYLPATLTCKQHWTFRGRQPRNLEILLSLSFDELSWDYTPAEEQNEDCLDTFWLEFDSKDNGKTKVQRLQIFSKQAIMMDAMVQSCVNCECECWWWSHTYVYNLSFHLVSSSCYWWLAYV
ncbi:predicted protein [Nematostella vectensis]|uniref:Uncharacterized protein n=1 Tax=Nematostella vectensis TaxID=45351 RepID=A7S7Q0_NEMVE|nr:predicted protein [Nematostella vectensis]|eukprot:XP_001632336.1 predicted protein [Nematostella vectensis]